MRALSARAERVGPAGLHPEFDRSISNSSPAGEILCSNPLADLVDEFGVSKLPGPLSKVCPG